MATVPTKLINAATFSVVGETITICRFEDEIIAFVNGKPMSYRLFIPLLMARISVGIPPFSMSKQTAIGLGTTDLMAKMTEIGVCDYKNFIEAAGRDTTACFEMLVLAIDTVIKKVKERSSSAEEALHHLILNIEEQYEAVDIEASVECIRSVIDPSATQSPTSKPGDKKDMDDSADVEARAIKSV